MLIRSWRPGSMLMLRSVFGQEIQTIVTTTQLEYNWTVNLPRCTLFTQGFVLVLGDDCVVVSLICI